MQKGDLTNRGISEVFCFLKITASKQYAQCNVCVFTLQRQLHNFSIYLLSHRGSGLAKRFDCQLYGKGLLPGVAMPH